MKLNVKYDYSTICKIVLQEQLTSLSVPYRLHGHGEIEFERPLNEDQKNKLRTSLAFYGIEIIEDQKSALVHRIKETINNMMHHHEKARNYKVSSYLSETLNYSYVYLSNVFSEVTYSSIENYVILKKIDHAKSLIISNNCTLTEIAYQLNYSSVAHLSYQFKKTTGLTPSAFQKIIQKRRANDSHN
ncbi:AraC family transcriptional regulator [Flavobacteriaceae bacterium KMM 6897]|nr:AraC family transcriptional regulator [Flavobacteriaceae bacterium KMM 6897]MEB8345227.1 AraC family transcriptional regulator [Flavobacteriaceae bacterium KMM 6898]